MAYAQWLEMVITNRIQSGNIAIRDAVCTWGKFYENDKDNEISADTVNNITISGGSSASVKSCGRSDSSSGTEGSLKLYEGSTHICTIHWDCPWGSKTNSFTVKTHNKSYMVQAQGANLDSGAIGTVEIDVAKF